MIVEEIDLFKGIDFEIMKDIADICSDQNYTKDTVLFEKDGPTENLYILENGTVNLVVKNGGLLSYNLSSPGEVFGWSSMGESGLYTASAVCATDVKAVRIERKKLDKIFKLHPDAGLKILRKLANVFSKRLSNAYRDNLSKYVFV